MYEECLFLTCLPQTIVLYPVEGKHFNHRIDAADYQSKTKYPRLLKGTNSRTLSTCNKLSWIFKFDSYLYLRVI